MGQKVNEKGKEYINSNPANSGRLHDIDNEKFLLKLQVERTQIEALERSNSK